MADSNITKRALAAALRELMEEVPFEKINVAHICEKCDMNRKSFYYHFKDKYDLINWIYDTEFIAATKQSSIENGWEFLSTLCRYLYANHDFYRKALKIQGQNSFSEHFREMIVPIIDAFLRETIDVQAEEKESIPHETMQQFYTNFIADGIISAIERWILNRNCLTADAFLTLVQSCVMKMAAKVYGEMKLSE